MKTPLVDLLAKAPASPDPAFDLPGTKARAETQIDKSTAAAKRIVEEEAEERADKTALLRASRLAKNASAKK